MYKVAFLSQGLNTRLCLAIFAGAFGSGFQHGYHTGVVNAPQKLISDWIQVCPEGVNGTEGFDSECAYTQNEVTMIWSWVVAIFCIGGLLGGCSIGLLSAKFGRKGTLLLNNVLVLLACVAMFAAKYANTYILLLVGRFLIGINSGINAGVSPMYLSEIAPVNLRGAVSTFLPSFNSSNHCLNSCNVAGNGVPTHHHHLHSALPNLRHDRHFGQRRRMAFLVDPLPDPRHHSGGVVAPLPGVPDALALG